MGEEYAAVGNYILITLTCERALDMGPLKYNFSIYRAYIKRMAPWLYHDQEFKF